MHWVLIAVFWGNFFAEDIPKQKETVVEDAIAYGTKFCPQRYRISVPVGDTVFVYCMEKEIKNEK